MAKPAEGAEAPRIIKVKCRNPQCSNPEADKIFTLPTATITIPVFLGKPGEKHEFIVHCPWCKWENKVIVD